MLRDILDPKTLISNLLVNGEVVVWQAQSRSILLERPDEPPTYLDCLRDPLVARAHMPVSGSLHIMDLNARRLRMQTSLGSLELLSDRL